MKVLYFAWLRAKSGIAEEDVDPPAGIGTVGELVEWLATRSPGHADALANRTVIRAAVNQEHVALTHAIRAGDEIALFPPVTGG